MACCKNAIEEERIIDMTIMRINATPSRISYLSTLGRRQIVSGKFSLSKISQSSSAKSSELEIADNAEMIAEEQRMDLGLCVL